LKHIAAEGLLRELQGVFLSVTNANNVQVCCWIWQDKQGLMADYNK
jgi:hypothetical protein